MLCRLTWLMRLTQHRWQRTQVRLRQQSYCQLSITDQVCQMTVQPLFQTAEHVAERMYPETRPQVYFTHYQLETSADNISCLTSSPFRWTRKALITSLWLLIILGKGPSHYPARKQWQQLRSLNCTMSTSGGSTEHLRQLHQIKVLSLSQHSQMSFASLWE